jgi:GNAT superfamily N-acetyltransferase
VTAHSAEPVRAEGCIVPFTYANGTGWIGFFCVEAGRRGKGWGRQLFDAALDRFATGGVDVVGLDAVAEQVPRYARSGFVEKARVRLLECPLDEGQRGRGAAAAVAPPAGTRLVPLLQIPGATLAAADAAHTGLRRARLWTQAALLSRPDVFGLALVAGGGDDDDDGEARDREPFGWVLVRGCQLGRRLGPLYAASAEGARALLGAAVERAAREECDEPVASESPAPKTMVVEAWPANEAALGVFEDAGFTPLGVDYHRMWLNGAVPPEQDVGGRAETDVYAIFDAGEG